MTGNSGGRRSCDNEIESFLRKYNATFEELAVHSSQVNGSNNPVKGV